MSSRKGKRQYQSNRLKTQKKADKDNSNYYSQYSNRIGSPTLWEYVFPIYNCITENNCVNIKALSGTTFYIGNNYFVTANHVLDYNEKYTELQQIGYLNQVTSGLVAKYNFEVVQRYPKYDVAIIKCDGIIEPEKKPKLFHWHHKGLKYYQTIRAKGYPSGYDSTKNYTTPRAFQGTRVGSIQFQKEQIDANCYELSFHCLRGLSGACLLDEGYQIHGIIIGNNPEELNFFDEMEQQIIEKPGETQKYTYMRSETVYIGLAVDKTEIFGLHCDEFGKTIHDYLKDNKLHKCHCS